MLHNGWVLCDRARQFGKRSARWRQYLNGGVLLHIDFPAGRRHLRCAIGASGLAIAVATSFPAIAACDPNPTQAYTTTSCTGITSDGVTVLTNGTTVRVEAGAELQAGSSAAGLVNVAGTNLIVNGAITGGSKPGVIVSHPASAGNTDPYTSPPPPFPSPYFGVSGLQITVDRKSVV